MAHQPTPNALSDASQLFANEGAHCDACSHTSWQGEDQPWWRVDLQEHYLIAFVRITGRSGRSGSLNPLSIFVEGFDGKLTQCSKNFALVQGQTLDIQCRNLH